MTNLSPEPPVSRSLIVTAVGVLHQVLGGLTAAGCAALLGLSLFVLADSSPRGCFGGIAVAVAGIAAIASVVGMAAVAVPLIWVGTALRRRRRWARLIALLLGGTSALAAVWMFSVAATSPQVDDDALVWGMVCLAWGLTVFGSLLPRRFAAEFDHSCPAKSEEEEH